MEVVWLKIWTKNLWPKISTVEGSGSSQEVMLLVRPWYRDYLAIIAPDVSFDDSGGWWHYWNHSVLRGLGLSHFGHLLWVVDLETSLRWFEKIGEMCRVAFLCLLRPREERVGCSLILFATMSCNQRQNGKEPLTTPTPTRELHRVAEVAQSY